MEQMDGETATGEKLERSKSRYKDRDELNINSVNVEHRDDNGGRHYGYPHAKECT